VLSALAELLLAIGVTTLVLAPLLSTRISAHRPGPDTYEPLRQTQGVPTPPQRRVDTSAPKVEGSIIAVSNEQEFQAALNRARPGDGIALTAGSVLYGNFVLPVKKEVKGSDAKWITITSTLHNSEAGVRVTPVVGRRFPKLVSMNAEPALRAGPGSCYYRLVGIELTIAPSVQINYGIVRLGEGSESSVNQLPHDIVIDRCYIHGLPEANVRRGIALNCANSAVIDSWISDCHEAGADSQAICCWNGPGPFELSGNYLEAAGENVMFGGADPAIPMLIPSDITFARNYCRKPLSWHATERSQSATRWSIKNLLELKSAERVLIERNVFDNNWVDAQTGYAILFKSVNQDGSAPWSATRNVIFRYNVVRHSSSAINVEDADPHNKSGRTALVLIENNSFQDIDSNRWGGEGAFLKITAAQDVHVDCNTALGNGSIIIAYGEPARGFVFTRNLVLNNWYGIKGDGVSTGTPTLEKFFPGAVVSGNFIVGGSPALYPPGNCFPPRLPDLRDRVLMSATGPCSIPGGKRPGCELDEAAVLSAAMTAAVADAER